jgi:hypothetical protein
MDVNPEIRERILAAAGQLFEQSGRKELPTVDAVRKLSKTSMNDASAVMREWRRLQIVSASAAVVSVPERVSQASAAALSTLWTEAQELANESLNVAQAAWDAERAEAEKLRVELSSAFESQGAELEGLKGKLAETEAKASAAAAAGGECAAGGGVDRSGPHGDGAGAGNREARGGFENRVECSAGVGGERDGGAGGGAANAWGNAGWVGGGEHRAGGGESPGGGARPGASRPGRAIKAGGGGVDSSAGGGEFGPGRGGAIAGPGRGIDEPACGADARHRGA